MRKKVPSKSAYGTAIQVTCFGRNSTTGIFLSSASVLLSGINMRILKAYN